MAESGIIRIGARAIITDAAQDKFLVEKNLSEPGQYLNFIGGGLEIGETLDECLKRELLEENIPCVTRMDYLFYVENFISYNKMLAHGIGFYYLVELEDDNVKSANKDFEFLWFTRNDLAELDLRPHVVRDCITDGSYRSVNRLISSNEIA